MRATINGINVEGTPQEIADYQKELDKFSKELTYGMQIPDNGPAEGAKINYK